MTSCSRSSVLLLAVGIFLGSLPPNALAAGIGTTTSKLIIPRIGINRSSKDNGGSLSFPSAEYATHRPYKIDFDLLQASDRSHELEMSVVHNNDIMDEDRDSSDEFFLASDPTLRSRRRRRRQVQAQQVISATSSDFQRFNLCLPYFNTNPACRQLLFGLTNSNNNSPTSNLVQSHAHGQHHPSALAVPSPASPSNTAYFIPAAYSPSSSISSISSNGVPVVAGGPTISRNDLAILNYYQHQQFPPQQQQQQQVPFQQLGVFQGPIPVERQRQQYDNIHVKYPYPYPPTEVQQPIQAIVPESGSTAPENFEGGNNAITTDVPSDIAQTTLLPEDLQEVNQQPGAGQQDPAAPAQPGYFPDSPVVQQPQPQEPEGIVDPVQTTTYNPSGMYTSSPLPPSSSQPTVDISTPQPSQEQSPPTQGGGVPVSPDQLNNPSVFDQAPPQQIIPNQVHHQIPAQPPPQPDVAMQKRLREKEEEIRRLQIQLDQASQQIVSYEQENSMVKDQFMRSEEANIKLRDRVLQLENTNQHLQEKNGELQQVSAEQRQQINGLKLSVKDAQEQLQDSQNQANPLSPEAVQHRKEVEDFLIRIRKLGEENETCQKQVKLYQLKVSYIMEQQRQIVQQQQQQQQQLQQQQLQIQQQQQLQQVQQEPQQQQQRPQQQKKKPLLPIVQTKIPTAADLTVHDDELDPELSRMDAEIAALQRNAEEVAAAIQKLPEPPVVQQLQSENLSSPVAVVAAVPASSVGEKKETEFPGEAVQVDPQQTKHKQQEEQGQKIATAADVARAESVARTIPTVGLPVWEQPAGF